MAENYQEPIVDTENETTLGNAIVAENDLAPNDDPRLDPILPSQMTSAQKLPSDHDMTMTEAMRQYRITQTTIDQRIKGPDTHFWGNAAKGIKDFGKEIAAFPDKFNAAVYRAFNGHIFPDMSEDEAVRLMEASTRLASHDQQMRDLLASYEGADDSIVRPFFSGAAQVISYGLVGALTGGVGIGVMAGVQEATDISQEMAENYMKENNGSLQDYKGSEDAIFAAAHGAVSGYIESFFGVERLFTNAIRKTGIKKIGEYALRAAAGEGTEEFLQEGSKYLFENLAGRNDRTFGEFMKDAVVNAAYGAALGGAFGGAMYYPNVRRIKKALKQQGYTEEQAKVLAPAIVNEAKEGILKEVDDRTQIREHYGEQWDNLKNKIVTALENAGWRETNPNIDLEKYAEDNADDIVRPLFRFSNKFGIDTRDLIQLADIDVIDNAIYLRPGDLGTPETIANRIKEKQAQVKRLTTLAKTGAGDPDAKRTLNTQIELLQKYYEKLTGDRFSAARRVRAGKAKMDAEILATTAPAVSETIAAIDTTQMSSGEPTTQIREKLDGQPFVYVGDKQLPVEYKVVSMDEIIASHIGQDINTNYSLKELQNRAQRGSRTDVSILQSRAAKIQPENLGIAYNTQNGAPVVNDKGEVIAGNGRYEVLRMTDEKGRARYNKYLESLGLDLTGIKDPILVRVMHNLTPEQQIAVADASNVSATSAFDNASQAAQDAKLLKGTTGVTDFLNKIPIESRQGLFLANDRVNKVALDRRYNDALMMWLLNGDTALYEELYLMGGITQKIQSALNQSIPGLMSLENQYPDVGIRKDLANALKRYPQVARSQDFALTVSQVEIDDGRPDLFNENVLLYALNFGKNTKTWEGTGPDILQVGLTLSEFFDTYTRKATTNQENIGQVDMFGQPLAVEQSRGDLLAETLTLAFPREFQDGAAVSRDMKAVFLTRAQTAPAQLNQIDLLDTVQPSLFADDTSTASAVRNLPWEKPVNVSNPTFFNRMPDANDIEIARNNGIDSFLILDKNEVPSKLVLLDGSVIGLKPGAKIPSGKDLYKPSTPTQLFQTSVFDLQVGDEIPGYGKVEQITDNKIKVGGTEYSKLRFDTMLQSVDFTPATVDFNKAVDYFGITNNLNIAGYILPDGRLLDFSGKKFGSDGRSRTIDHREVGDAYDNEIDMDDFLKNGAIRIDATSGSINIGAKPTTAQMRIIEQIVARNTDSVSLELENNGPSLNEVYDDTTPTNIKRIITQYFNNNGRVSKVAQFYQAAYAGSRVDYDQPSLEAIGSGEGNQAHGWGLYYALNPEIAERYRQAFTGDYTERVDYKGKDIPLDYSLSYDQKENAIYNVRLQMFNNNFDSKAAIASLIKSERYNLETYEKSLQDLETQTEEKLVNHYKRRIEATKNLIKIYESLNPADFKKHEYGQVHQVDVPEMDVLLDEQKTFDQQTPFVQEAVKKAIKEAGLDDEFNLTTKDDFISIVKSKVGNEAADIMSDIYDGEVVYEKDKDNSLLDNAWSRWNEFESTHDTKGFDPNDVYKYIRNKPTGGEIYRALAEYHQSDKDASQMLEKYGIKGITYDGRQDGRCFVIFNPKDVKVLRKKFDELGNQLFQGRKVNGFYDPELEVIVLGRSSNTGTLPHEMSHYWANTIFNLVKSGKYNNNPDFMAQAMGMFRMLGVGMNQDTLTRDQQEMFASMTEAVIFGMAPIPQGTELPMTAFLNWVPQKYKSILDIGYRNSEGRIVNPILDKQAVEWFNAWYANGTLPSIDASPLMMENSNGEQDGRIIPSSTEVMKVRVTEMTTESDNLKRARTEQMTEVTDSTPASERAAAAGAEVKIESQPGNIERSEPPAEKKRGIMSYLIPGRGTNTREEMFAAARDYISKERAHAEEIAFGSPATVPNDTGVDRAILIRALMEEYKQGDPEYAELYHNLAETVSLAGKTPGLSNDMNFQFYNEAVRRITDGMEGIAAIKYAGTRNLNKARRTFNSDIDAFIQEHAAKILNTAPDTDRREMLIKQMLAEASVKFAGDNATQLNQEDLRRGRSIKSADRAVFIEWANREVRKMLKATPDTDIINRTMELSEKAEKARKYLDSNDNAEVQAAGKTIREWQLFVAEKEVPETWYSKLIGSWYPKAMLYNINTHLVNMTGNTFNYGIVHAAVAAQYKQGNKVSKQSLNAEKERLHRLYDTSLMNLAAMESPTSPTLLHGEQYNPREGKSTIGKVADFSMDLLGKEDAMFRIRAYLDALGHIATADAVKTGGSPTELFNEYKKINNPKGTRAYEARLEALRISDIAVFQQTGVLSSALKKVRDALNFGQRGGLGTLLGPFVKTPANIVEQGARAILAPITSTYHGLTGKWTIQDSLDTGYFALACILTMGLMADYEPPYEVPQRYDQNKPYDSIRIRGTNTWIKLDTFAAAAVPLRIIASIATGKGLGIAGAFDEIPLIGDLSDAYREAARIEKDPYKQGTRFVANWAYNRVNTAVPAIIKYTLAAMHPADLNLDELDLGLPKTGIGRKIGRQYGLDGGDTTTNDILRIFFNRLKVYKE